RHHGTKNRLRSLVLLPPGGGEVVRGRGCEPIQAQPGGEFGVGVAELVGRESSIEIRAVDWAPRIVLGQPIGPLRSSLLHSLYRHPDDSLMRKTHSPHGHTLPGTKNALTFRTIVRDIGRSQPPW